MSSLESSSSGEITSSVENISNVFTQYTEIPSSGFNCLFKAQRYGKWFVLKGLRPEHRNEAIYLELLTKEFELGIQMDHPNIARTYSFETDPVAGPCIIMEYVDGITLKEFLKAKPSLLTRNAIADQLLHAMAYYHGKQIVHRDLKPDNILITHNGHNVKIIDFGLADSDTFAVLKQPAGSPKYMAPEQIKGDVKIDARADLYSFAKILKQVLPIWHGKWGTVISWCDSYDREKRLPDANAIVERLKQGKRQFLITSVCALLLFICITIVLFLTTLRATDKQPMPQVPSETASESATDTIRVPQNEIQTTVPAPVKTAVPETEIEISPAALQQIEKCIDTIYKPFWDAYFAATDKRTGQMDYGYKVPTNDTYYERRESILKDVKRKYPQFSAMDKKLEEAYGLIYYNKMKEVSDSIRNALK